ncbi:Subunit of heteropentameric Replication factor C (RF-C) [Dispira parvispora]|uniref:Replication factor C subunit 3 n=1 Tax=Dispira parvispora TaxID=1520584 RepID=A0A9W8ATS4_9FUNG|nr:Subunit of heteropentameric Replication factor C (RF-C) [Dispira parvispora]
MTQGMQIDSSEADKPNKGKAPAGTSKANHENLPWVEKYRPETLQDLVCQDQITSTINKFIDENRLPHVLFYGPPGTGKTSTILACAKKLYGKHYKTMTLELNASDDRGIGVVREQIVNFASTREIFNLGFKLVILDEADAMTQAAQAALRRVIEKYTKNVRFCIICNYASKIIPAIQSRCTRFRFAPLADEHVRKRLQYVADMEHVQLTPAGADAILHLSKGDMRRVLNILQACHSAFPTVDDAAVYICTGSPYPEDIRNIFESMLSDEFTTTYTLLTQLKLEKGLALHDVISELYTCVDEYNFPAPVGIYLLDKMAQVEYNLNTGATEKLQVSALIGHFKYAMELAAQTK